MATREAYGSALAKIATTHPRVVALDGDMKNSTFSQSIKKVDENRYIECFICEQNLVGVGIGVACRDRTIAFVSTFACFLTRAFDNLRMGVISQTNLNVMGSHCGVSIGEDGPSQMALEDLAMFQSLPGCTVFYPSDAVAMERAVELAASTRGITFLRAGRPQVLLCKSHDGFDQLYNARCLWCMPMMSSSRLARLRFCGRQRETRLACIVFLTSLFSLMLIFLLLILLTVGADCGRWNHTL